MGLLLWIKNVSGRFSSGAFGTFVKCGEVFWLITVTWLASTAASANLNDKLKVQIADSSGSDSIYPILPMIRELNTSINDNNHIVTLLMVTDNSLLWDQPLVEKSYAQVLESFADSEVETARILAASTKESGAWLNALPACLGNLLDDDSLRISVGLRLEAPICEPHTCRCSAMVDVQGRYGLSCKYSAGRHSRHSSLSESVRRALVSCQEQAVLEPNGVLRDESKKRPDGITLVPWKEGKALVWDVTCVDSLCQTYRKDSSEQAGYAANRAEDNKRAKYRRLEGSYHFCPVGFETFGTFGPAASALLMEIGKNS